MISKEQLDYIIERIVNNAKAAKEDYVHNKSDKVEKGILIGCYESLNILKNELFVADYNIEETALNIDLEKEFLMMDIEKSNL